MVIRATKARSRKGVTSVLPFLQTAQLRTSGHRAIAAHPKCKGAFHCCEAVIAGTVSPWPRAGSAGFAPGIRLALVPQRSDLQRPRRLQKKPPPPNRSTNTTMIKSVSVDIHWHHRPRCDFSQWGVSLIRHLDKRGITKARREGLGRPHATAPERSDSTRALFRADVKVA